MVRIRAGQPSADADAADLDDSADDDVIDINVGGMDLEVAEASDADDDESDGEEESKRWLGAITHVGTNYATVQGYTGEGYDSHHVRRVHIDIFDTVCTLEPNAEAIISGNATRHAANARDLMARVAEITRRLGVTPRAVIKGDPCDCGVLTWDAVPFLEYNDEDDL
jgi:hypothetical protein